MTAGIMFCMAYVFVFAKAYQQRNVIHNNWLAVPLFSFMMAFLELASVSIGVIDISQNGWHRLAVLGIAQGAGGALGCWTAMWLHNRINRREHDSL